MDLPDAILQRIDAALEARNDHSRLAIEEELAKIYAVGEDVPTVEDDELHDAISFLHARYVRCGQATDEE